jgi:putative transposase
LVQDGVAGDVERGELRGMVMRLGMQRLVQELLEGEQRDFLGVERYERAGERRGHRNGYEPTHVETGEGRIAVHVPQVRNSAEPFESQLLVFLKGRTATVERLVSEMYAHGLSTRDIEAAFTDATGSCVLSKSTVSEVTSKLWEEYQAFRQQRWDGIAIDHLFADGLYDALEKSGDHRDAILCVCVGTLW